ncbi:MAG: hypothetical protein CMF74_08950 [Maricaulis sp.]|nr:hypothetical protein [Maricaulis sp.]
MTRVLSCLAFEHDLALVVLAGLLCAVSAMTTVMTLRRAGDADAHMRRIWLVAAAVVTGLGIWGTHFIAMLAYAPGLAIGFDLTLTLTSIVVAVVVTGCGWTAAMLGGNTAARIAGGALAGLGVGAMHFTGMSAMLIGARIGWSADLVVSSLVIGAAGMAAASVVMFSAKRPMGRVAAAALMVLSIVGLHFTAMGAMTLTPDPALVPAQSAISPAILAIVVAVGGFAILAINFAGVLFDTHLGNRRVDEAERMRQLAAASFEGVALEVDDVIADVNPQLCLMLDRSAKEIIGTRLSDHVVDGDSGTSLASSGSGHAQAGRLLTSSGDTLPVEILSRDMPMRSKTARVFAVRDISEREQAEAQILHMAHHDALTGLANRSRFRVRLADALSDASRDRSPFAVVCLDLDRFKSANDIFGHAAGDAVLKKVAERITERLAPGETAARLGGDEFALVLTGHRSVRSAANFAEKLIAALSETYPVHGHEISIGASAGIAMYPADGDSAEVLMSRADLALYRGKSEGRSAVRMFEPEMDALLRERRRLENDLRGAIDNDQLELHYQPQANAETGEIVGFEALVRWNHPVDGLVAPDNFIGLAEECGVIVAIGDWVIFEACREAVGWPVPYRISVNVSPVQFKQGNLVLSVTNALKQSGLDPKRLEVEITEGVLIDDRERALDQLQRLKALGVRVAMDDFGTGYSSMSYLRTFPFDQIKLDRSFITGLSTNREARAIVRATTSLARDLDMGVVAEGVEFEDDLDFLRNEQRIDIQGYLLSRPLSRGQISEFLGNVPDLRKSAAVRTGTDG